MLRYNHALVEAKWRKNWKQPCLARTTAVSITLCQNRDRLDLENARLLVLADFVAGIKWREKPCIIADGLGEDWLNDASKLGLVISDCRKREGSDLAVLPRDYAYTIPSNQASAKEFLFVGRLLQTESASLSDLLADFGGDALRLYFLYMGPLERDYEFQWHGVVSAYRFVTRLWELGQRSSQGPNPDYEESQQLSNLRIQVSERLTKGKPHTALAAIMGYLKNKTGLTRIEIRSLAELLQPFAPFICAELLAYGDVLGSQSQEE